MHKNQFGITRMNLEHLKTFHVVASLGREFPAVSYSRRQEAR